jgi:hypothetical protein
VATVVGGANMTAVVTAVATGSATITATIEGVSGNSVATCTVSTSSDPVFVQGTSTLMFSEDWSTINYTCCQDTIFLGGWARSPTGCGIDNTNDVITIPTGQGYGGTPTSRSGKCARWNWPTDTNEQFFVLSHSAGTNPSGQTPVNFQFWYRAMPGFVYKTTFPRVGKKHFLIWPNGTDGSQGRWTNGVKGWSYNISNGSPITSDWDQFPNGLTADQFETTYINDGNWHRYTYQRIPETANGAANGAIRVWCDGLKVLERTNFGTWALGVDLVQVAGTFNGGSSQNQDEFFDEFRFWYG